MYMGQIEIDMGLRIVLEMNELLLNRGVFEEGELIFPYADALILPGIFVQIVVITKPVLIQQLVHHFTTFATERF